MLRCPSIYLAMFIFWILIGIAMMAAMIGAAFVVFAAIPAGLLYTNIYAGLRFIFGAYIALFLTWAAIYWFFIIIIRSGLAGMYLRLHQGRRPGLGDFGRGVVKYVWQFLKGYFHIAMLYAIPLLIIGGWVILRYAAYSSLIFESRWNTGLRIDFINGIHHAFDLATVVIALVYCFLMVWDESVVLEGSTFAQGFTRSANFAIRNLPRLIPVAIINFLILRIPGFVAENALSASLLGSDMMKPGGTVLNPSRQVEIMRMFMSDASWPFIIYIVLLFILSPIIAYTQYVLYIPNRPFRPGAGRKPVTGRDYISEDDHAGEEPGDESAGNETGSELLREESEGKRDILKSKPGEPDEKPISGGKGNEPGDDVLRLDK